MMIGEEANVRNGSAAVVEDAGRNCPGINAERERKRERLTFKLGRLLE